MFENISQIMSDKDNQISDQYMIDDDIDDGMTINGFNFIINFYYFNFRNRNN